MFDCFVIVFCVGYFNGSCGFPLRLCVLCSLRFMVLLLFVVSLCFVFVSVCSVLLLSLVSLCFVFVMFDGVVAFRCAFDVCFCCL